MDYNNNSNIDINYKQKKSSGITFVFNFCVVPGSGFIYLGDKYITRGIIFVLINFFLVFITIISSGAGFILLIPFWIIMIVLGFSATEEYNESVEIYNKNVNENAQMEYQKKQKMIKENEIHSRKVKCVEFVDKLEKYNKLLKNELLTEKEFNDKKQKLINEIVLYKVAENPEDFLSVILDLKVKDILTNEDLQNIKKSIL